MCNGYFNGQLREYCGGSDAKFSSSETHDGDGSESEVGAIRQYSGN